jgi:regulator of replication initiation timing
MTRERGEGTLESGSSFKKIVEKLRTLENERKNLLLEIEELKKMADSKAKALESEVGMLREEVKSLRLLLGAEEQSADQGQEPKKKPRK